MPLFCRQMTDKTSAPVSPLRKTREAQGLSRESLAGRAGISLRSLERIEAGKVNPHRATLHVLAAVLGVSPDELREAA
jgi:transcriptional regulator with XRE-family HTH domain